MKKAPNKNHLISVVFLILLVVSFSTGFYLQCHNKSNSYYFFGFGCGLFGVFLAFSIKSLMMKKNERFRKKQSISETDERIKLIQLKSWSITGFISILALASASLVCAFSDNMTLASVFSGIISTECIIYFIVYIILSHKE